jgi:hypothetical protein
MSYTEQRRYLLDQYFGTADFYSWNLNKLGHEAEDIIANCEPLQRQWAQEHGLGLEREWTRVGIRRRGRILLPMLRRSDRYVQTVLAAQVKRYKPDVLYVQNIGLLSSAFIRETLKPHARLVAGQHASPMPPVDRWREYDLILSSLLHQVEQFRQAGLKSEYLAIGFEPRVLDRLGPVEQRYSVVHVGGYSSGAHSPRMVLLEEVARHVPVDFWGYGAETLSARSPIMRRYHGEAWGLDMYRARAAGKITLTKHSAASGHYANNMTLFETTGIGRLLLTDHKSNLSELFESGKEVVSYTSPEDCVEKVRHYLEHDEERETIGRAGQQRTLREHTYYHRMQELTAIIKRYL